MFAVPCRNHFFILACSKSVVPFIGGKTNVPTLVVMLLVVIDGGEGDDKLNYLRRTAFETGPQSRSRLEGMGLEA